MAEELELYIHIPFCKQKCFYCDFLSFANQTTQIPLYIAKLIQEIEAMSVLALNKVVSSVFLGGGTPSILEEHWIEAIMEAVFLNYIVGKDAEITIEANPKTLTKKKLFSYLKSGITRLSMGLQSSDNAMLNTIGRIHTYEDFLENYNLARACGFMNINIDYMSGLPNQSVHMYEESLKKVLQLHPEHISAYALIIEENTPFYAKFESDVLRRQRGEKTFALPDEDMEYQMTKSTGALLKENGYLQYEISNFAQKGFECAHNIGYWQRKDYLGFGLGASSCYQNVRFVNTNVMNTYLQLELQTKAITLEEVTQEQLQRMLKKLGKKQIQFLSVQEQMEEYMFLGLRLVKGISKAKFKEVFQKDIFEIYEKPIKRLISEKLLEENSTDIFPTRRGLEVNNYVGSMFLQE